MYHKNELVKLRKQNQTIVSLYRQADAWYRTPLNEKLCLLCDKVLIADRTFQNVWQQKKKGENN